MRVNPSEIREELHKLERKHAENPEGRYFVPLANAYRKSGDMDRAIEVLREGLQTHTDYVSAHIVLGRCLADKGDVAAAESEFRRVLSLDPQNLIALRTIGEISLEDGRIEEAQRWYRELLKVDPMNEDARRALDGIQVIPAPSVTSSEAAPERREATSVPAWQEPDEPVTRPAPSAPEPASKPISTAAEFDLLFSGGREVSDTGHDEDLPFAVEGQSVVTETIAELYTRQGFYARAADVYRELIRRRGSSPDLEERLRRVEGLAAGTVEQDLEASRPAPLSTPAALPADGSMSETEIPGKEADAFADSFLDGFTRLDDEESAGLGGLAGSYEEVESEEVVSPVSEEGGIGPGGETIREYLAAVLSWRPESRTEAVTSIPEMAEPGDALTAYEPTPGLIRSYDEELFPWEQPDEPSAAAGVEPREEPTDVAAAEDESPEIPMAAAPVPPPAEEPASLDEPVPAAGPAAEETAPPPAASTEDEDLESFQAWLRSLKR